MTAPIYNPIVPFMSGVQLRPGFMVYVTGTPTGDRFQINFKTGHAPTSDIAFHLATRFDEGNVVVRNSRRNGRWETEERQTNGFPFVRGQSFEIIFLCQQNQFKVAVNGRHFVEFRHRLSMNSVTALEVQGAVKLSLIRFDQETQRMAPKAAFNQLQKVIHNPAMPFKAVVPFNNMKNRRVTINGSPINSHPYRFMVDFITAAATPDIFFHFNPRFSEQAIVRNARLRGAWGNEERNLGIGFPFQYGVPFQLTFHVDQNCFRVELNGTLLCTFNHRQRPLNQIRHVSIYGSASVSRVAFE